MLTVWVDFPPDLPPTAKQVALEACTEGLGRGVCLELTPGGRGDFVLRVIQGASNGDTLTVAVAGTGPGPAGTANAARSLQFSSDHPVLDRWTAVGLVVGSLATELARVERPTSASVVPHTPPRLPAPDPFAEVVLGAVLTPPIAGKTDHYGLFMAAALDPFNWPVWLGITARYTVHPGDPALDWWSVGTGPTWRVVPGRGLLEWQLRLELVWELVRATTTRDGQPESDSRHRLGGRVSAMQGLRLTDSSRLVVGASVDYAEPSISIRAAGRTASEVGRAQGAGFIGLGWTWQ